MKVEVIKQNEKQDLPFPKLMKQKNSNLIVLFICQGSGIIVNESGGRYQIGFHAKDWDMGSFEDFHGKVILSNEETK